MIKYVLVFETALSYAGTIWECVGPFDTIEDAREWWQAMAPRANATVRTMLLP